MTNDERRYNAGRPYYRPKNKLQVTKREDLIFVVVLAFTAGAMLGATIALAVGA
jgi:hypothetical protein